MTVPNPPGPPFDLDVLADLHAGVYPEDVAARLRARAAADPAASATLAALDATVADLRAAPPIPMPVEVAERLDAAIAAEAAARASGPVAPMAPSPPHGASAPPVGTSSPSVTASPWGTPSPSVSPPPLVTASPSAPGAHQVSSLDRARRDREHRRADSHRRQARWAIGLGIAAAVAAVFTIGAVILRPGGTPGTGVAGAQIGPTSATTGASSPSGAAPSGTGAGGTGTSGAGPGVSTPPDAAGSTRQAIVAEPHHLDRLLPQLEGTAPEGPFEDPMRLAACLAANDVTSNHVLGVLPVTYTGKSGYAISVRTGASTVLILVVGPGCGSTGPDLLDEQTATG